MLYQPVAALKKFSFVGDEQRLFELYSIRLSENLKSNDNHSAKIYKGTFNIWMKTKTIYRYMKKVIHKSMSIGFVVEPIFWKFSKYGILIRKDWFKETLFELVEQVE